MSRLFEELAWTPTAIGTLSLRRRRQPGTDVEVYEIKLDDEFLMSSLFTVAEEELARLGLAAVEAPAIDVAVGGLGLGYTARAALEDSRVRSLTVIEALPEIIDWHRTGLLPQGPELTGDPRCRLRQGDFFALAGDPAAALDPDAPDRRYHAILVDIDHSPSHHLDPSHAGFYGREGLARLAARLAPGGIFGLWSNDLPDPAFVTVLGAVFAEAEAHVVRFPNPVRGSEETNTVYVAQGPHSP